MAKLPPDIVALVESEKTLGVTPEWNETSDPRYFEILVPLTVGAVTIGGFDLRIKVSKQHVARDAVAQLEFGLSGRRSAVGLWRICWKPFSIHQNDGFPADCPFETFAGTHEHRFDDNYLSDEARMRSGNLPGGRGLQPDPETLSDFLALCGVRFRIKDIWRVRPPVMTPDLFWMPAG